MSPPLDDGSDKEIPTAEGEPDLKTVATLPRLTLIAPSEPRTIDDFLPGAYYNATLVALQSKVFDIDHRSASPITVIIGKQLSEVEILKLIRPPWDPPNAPTHAAADAKKRAKLQEKMDGARKVHAINLRARDVQDVDITYTDKAAHLAIFKGDQLEITESRGMMYHLRRAPKPEKEKLCMSVLMKTETLEELFPARRLAKGGIKIDINTAHAPDPPRNPPSPEFRGTIFPYYRAELSKGVLELDDEARKERAKLASQKIDEICENRPRSDSVEKVKKVKKGQWHHFGSSIRIKQPQPAWTPENAPFTGDYTAANDRWPQTDFVVRRVELSDFLGNLPAFHQRQMQRDRDNGLPISSFPVMPGMCGTFVATRERQDYELHAQTTLKIMEKENEMELAYLEHDFPRVVMDATKHREYLGRAVWQGQTEQGLRDQQLQSRIKFMQLNQRKADNKLEASRTRIIDLRRVLGRHETGIYKGMQDEYEIVGSQTPVRDWERQQKFELEYYPERPVDDSTLIFAEQAPMEGHVSSPTAEDSIGFPVQAFMTEEPSPAAELHITSAQPETVANHQNPEMPTVPVIPATAIRDFATMPKNVVVSKDQIALDKALNTASKRSIGPVDQTTLPSRTFNSSPILFTQALGSSNDTIPFPAYEDPFEAAMKQTSQNIIKDSRIDELREEARAFIAPGRGISNVLSETGILREPRLPGAPPHLLLPAPAVPAALVETTNAIPSVSPATPEGWMSGGAGPKNWEDQTGLSKFGKLTIIDEEYDGEDESEDDEQE